MSDMRLAADRSGALMGPYSLASLQRKGNSKDALLTMRLGYANIEDNEATYLYTGLDIYQRRDRTK